MTPRVSAARASGRVLVNQSGILSRENIQKSVTTSSRTHCVKKASWGEARSSSSVAICSSTSVFTRRFSSTEPPKRTESGKTKAEEFLEKNVSGKSHEDFDPWKMKVDEDGKLYWHHARTGEKKYQTEKPTSKNMAIVTNLGYGALMAIMGVFFVKMVLVPSRKQ